MFHALALKNVSVLMCSECHLGLFDRVKNIICPSAKQCSYSTNLLIFHHHLPVASLKYPEVLDLHLTFFYQTNNFQTLQFKIAILKISVLVDLVTPVVTVVTKIVI